MYIVNRHYGRVEDEINVPIALSAFRDKLFFWYCIVLLGGGGSVTRLLFFINRPTLVSEARVS